MELQGRCPMSRESLPAPKGVLKAYVEQLLYDVARYERECELAARQDAFLDAYSEWLKTHHPVARLRVEDLARELERLDATFRFAWPRELHYTHA